MSFDSYERKLTIHVNKESLQVISNSVNNNLNDAATEITKKTVVFETKLVISEDSFVY